MTIFVLALTAAFQTPLVAQDDPHDQHRRPEGQWSMYGYDPQRTFFAEQEHTLTEDSILRLEEKWRFIVDNDPLDDPNSVTASPVVADGIAYFGDWRGVFYAVDSLDGALVWKKDLKTFLAEASLDPNRRDVRIFTTALTYDGKVYTGINQLMFAFDAKTGDLVWQKNIMDPITQEKEGGAGFVSSATVAFNEAAGKDLIYIGGPSIDCVRGVLRAIDPQTGDFVWSFFVDGGTENVAGELRPNGEPARGGGIWTSPAVSSDGETVYVTTSNACGDPPQPELAPALIAINAADGTLEWSANPRTHDVDDLAIGNTPNFMRVITPAGTIVELVGFADKDGSYYAYFADDKDDDGFGDLVWRTDVTPASFAGGFDGIGSGVAYNRIFAGSFLGPPFMHAFDAWSGEVAWQSLVSGPSFAPVGISNFMVFKGDEGSPALKVYDAADGGLLRLLPTPEVVTGAPVILDRHVIVTMGSARPYLRDPLPVREQRLPNTPEGPGIMAFFLPGGGPPPLDPNPLPQ